MAGMDPDLVWGNILDATGDLMEWSNETTFLLEPDLTSSSLFYISEPESMIDPFHSNQYFLTIILTHAITFIVGVIGNSVVISTWARGGKIRSPTTTFLVSLACADLLLLIIFMPLETAEYFVITWDKHGYICKLSSFVELLSGMASILNLVAVSVERYLVIVYPIQARRWCTVTKSRRSLLFVWILAIILAAPPVFNKSTHSITYYNQETEITAYYCFEQNGTWAVTCAIYELMLLFVIPAILMVLCYSRVIRELWTSTRVISVLTSNNATPSVSTSNSASKMHKSYLVRWHQNNTPNNGNNACLQQGQPSQHANSNSTLANNANHHMPQQQQQQQRRPVSIAVNYHEATEVPLPTSSSTSSERKMTRTERKCTVTNNAYPSLSTQTAVSPSSKVLFQEVIINSEKCTSRPIDEQLPHPQQYTETPDSPIVNGAYQYSLPTAGLGQSLTKLFKPELRDKVGVERPAKASDESSTTSTENVPTIAIGSFYRERSNSLNFLLKTCSQVYRYIQCCLCCLICCLTWNRKPAQPEVVSMHRTANYVQHPASLVSFNTITSNTLQTQQQSQPQQQNPQGLQQNAQQLNRHLMPPTPTLSHLTVRSFPNIHSSSSTNVYQHSINGGFKASVTDVRHARKQLYCQVIKMLLLIVILFLVCWGPRLVFNVIKSAGFEEFSKYAYSARVYFYLLSFIHSALNPFVYGFMSSNFRIIFFRRHRHRAKCGEGVPNAAPNHSSVPSMNDKLPERMSPHYSLNETPNRPNSNNSNAISHNSGNGNWKPDSSTSSLREIESEIEQAVQVDREQHRARHKRHKPKRTESVQTTVGTRNHKRPFLHKYLHRRSASLFLFPNRKQQTPITVQTVIGAHSTDQMTQCQHTAHSF